MTQKASRSWAHQLGLTNSCQTVVAERVQEETNLWDAIEWVPDLQAAWQILVQLCRPEVPPFGCGTLPPSQSSEYALLHDAGMLRAMKSLLGGLPGEPQEKEDACRLATLPMRMGGLGLRSATRMAPAAYWASWADALHMVQAREASRFGSVNCGPIGSCSRTCWLLERLACSRKHVGTDMGSWRTTSMASVAGGHASTSRH